MMVIMILILGSGAALVDWRELLAERGARR
jgi:hypothetical protein